MKERSLRRAVKREDGTLKLEEYREVLIWRFYFRSFKKWFVPCDKCQKTIDELVKVNMDSSAIQMALGRLCPACNSAREVLFINAEVILGNKDYEPSIELNRTWLDKNDDRCKPTIDVLKDEVCDYINSTSIEDI